MFIEYDIKGKEELIQPYLSKELLLSEFQPFKDR